MRGRAQLIGRWLLGLSAGTDRDPLIDGGHTTADARHYGVVVVKLPAGRRLLVGREGADMPNPRLFKPRYLVRALALRLTRRLARWLGGELLFRPMAVDAEAEAARWAEDQGIVAE